MKMWKRMAALLAAALLLTLLPACEQRVDEAAESAADAEEPAPLPAPAPEPEPDEPAGTEADAERAREQAEAFLAALASADPDRIGEFVDYDELLQLESGQPDNNFRAILGHLRYEVVDAHAEGGVADVTARLTNIGMTAVLPASNQRAAEMEYQNAISENPLDSDAMEARYLQLFADMLEENADITVETVVVLKLAEEDGQWRVQLSDALRNAATGDYFTARKNSGVNAGGGQS